MPSIRTRIVSHKRELKGRVGFRAGRSRDHQSHQGPMFSPCFCCILLELVPPYNCRMAASSDVVYMLHLVHLMGKKDWLPLLSIKTKKSPGQCGSVGWSIVL